MAASSSRPLSELVRDRRDLCVSPLFWTSRLIELLGCRFQDSAHASDETEALPLGGHDASRQANDNEVLTGRYWQSQSEAEELVESFAKSCAPQLKSNAITKLLTDKGSIFERNRKCPQFYFAGQAVHRCDCIVFSRARQPNNKIGQVLPRQLIGYFDYPDVDRLRRQKLQPRRHPSGGHNALGWSLSLKMLSDITPKEWSRDPYLVCILLSMVQFQTRKLKSPQPVTPTRLLVTNVIDPEFIYLFEAEITSELIEMLDEPIFATKQGTWPTIKRRKIPFKPYRTFQERLVAELLALNPGPHHKGQHIPQDTKVF